MASSHDSRDTGGVPKRRCSERVYLDHNATTPARPEVIAAMTAFMGEHFGNPSSLHDEGLRARTAVEEAREEVATLLGAKPSEIVFTSGGTEGNNLAIRGVAEVSQQVRQRVVTSQIEHPSVLRVCEELERRGFPVTYVGVDRLGYISPMDVEKALNGDTKLLSIMLANNEVGTIQAISAIAGIARSRGVLIHTDAVQACGRIPVNVDELGTDLLTVSAHKVGGPKGIGALYIRDGVTLCPQVLGGGQEGRRRAGTENVPAIVGFGKAAKLAALELPEVWPRIRRFRDALAAGIGTSIKDAMFFGDQSAGLPTTISVGFRGCVTEDLVVWLDGKGLAVSGGSACGTGAKRPSHVLTAMGVEEPWMEGAVRISLGRETNEREIRLALAILCDAVEELRMIAAAV